MHDRNHLPKGYRLQEYEIERVLGEGGFGITYLAKDTRLKKQIVIKEFLPRDFASRKSDTYQIIPDSGEKRKTYQYFLKKFEEEAILLASIKHLNIVKVTRAFEANNTAYFVMDYIEGESLKSYISSHGTLSEEKVLKIMIPILEGLKEVHKKNFLHRDIAPDNIYIAKNKMPILIDFGAARDLNQDKSHSLASVVKKGYSAPEQYISTSKHTPATDIYAVGAVMLTMISGKVPPEAISRMYNSIIDPIETLLNRYKGKYSQKFLNVIAKAMSLEEKDRFQNVSELQESWLNDVVQSPKVPSKGGMWLKKIMFIFSGVMLGGGYFAYDTYIRKDSKQVKSEDKKEESKKAVLKKEIPKKNVHKKVKVTTKKWNPKIYRGERSYTKNSEHTVKDNYTRLIWQKEDDRQKRTWKEAVNYCKNLSLAGLKWRLPEQEELYSLVDVRKYNPAIDTNYFNVKSDVYWSNTSSEKSYSAWYTDFTYGKDDVFYQNAQYYSLCVSG